MKTYANRVLINGCEFNNLVTASNFKQALAIQKERKANSNNKYIGRLTFIYSL